MLSTQYKTQEVYISLMDPGIFPSSGDRPGFGPESQKYGDPRSEILGFRGQPGTALAPRTTRNSSAYRGRRSESLFTSSIESSGCFPMFADGGGDGCTVHCLTTHVLLALERLRTTRFCYIEKMPISIHVMPPKKKELCCICCQPISVNKDKVLYCSGSCQQWLHRYCASVTSQQYQTIKENAQSFLCPCCDRREQQEQINSLKSTVEALKLELSLLKESLLSVSSHSAPTVAIYRTLQFNASRPYRRRTQ